MSKLKSIEFFDGFQSEVTPSSSLPSIGDVFVVADIAARDALVIGIGEDEVTESDVCIVMDATADPEVDLGGASYIYDGSSWQRLINPTDVVQSVNGQIGTVSLDTDDVSEGVTNQYYTQARFNSALSTKTTNDLVEGSNLYFTDSRAKNAVGADLANKQDIQYTFNIEGEIENPMYYSYNSPKYIVDSRTFTSVEIITVNQIGELTVELRSYDMSGGDQIIHSTKLVSLTSLQTLKTTATLSNASIGANRLLKMHVKLEPNASSVVPYNPSLSVTIK